MNTSAILFKNTKFQKMRKNKNVKRLQFLSVSGFF